MQRRVFIKAATAAAVIAAMPLADSRPAAADSVLVDGKAEITAGDYGYSLDGSYWYSGFATREAALAEATSHRDIACVTAKVIQLPARMPGRLAEAMANSLGTGELVEHIMVDDLVNENEDIDYEGEFRCACETAETESLAGPTRRAVAAAFARAGEPMAAAAILAGDDLPDGIDAALTRLEADDILEAELQAALAAWVDRNALGDSMRGVSTAEIQPHTPAPAADTECPDRFTRDIEELQFAPAP